MVDDIVVLMFTVLLCTVGAGTLSIILPVGDTSETILFPLPIEEKDAQPKNIRTFFTVWGLDRFRLLLLGLIVKV